MHALLQVGACAPAHTLPWAAFSVPSWGLQVAVSDLGGTLLSGRYEVEGRDLRVTLHRSAGVQQLGGTLLALPFLEAPHLRVR